LRTDDDRGRETGAQIIEREPLPLITDDGIQLVTFASRVVPPRIDGLPLERLPVIERPGHPCVEVVPPDLASRLTMSVETAQAQSRKVGRDLKRSLHARHRRRPELKRRPGRAHVI
jgi:hypothetical protein